jgi:segregation and condensation protein B
MSDIEKAKPEILADATIEAAPESDSSAPHPEETQSVDLGDLISNAKIDWQLAESGIEFALESEVEAEAVTEAEVEAEAEAPQLQAEDDEATAEEPLEFIEAEHAISIIESLLFASDKPVSIGTFKQVFKGTNIRGKDISRALDILASEYASSQRGVSLEEIHGGYHLRTKVDNAEYLRRLAKTRPFKLSGPALETLAIVAYKQPAVKSEIDEIRGVESGHLMRALMERGLISFAGKSELPGKPMQYGTTRKFLEIFGLRNLKELPTLSEIEELLPDGIGHEEEEKKETLSDISGELSGQVAGTYSEGEEELIKITDHLQAINTSSEFFEQEKIRQREKRDQDRAQDIREALAVGEAVDDKDQKWLARFEAKLLADQEAKLQAAAALAASLAAAELAGETATRASDLGEEASEPALAAVDLSAEVGSEALELNPELELTDEDYADDFSGDFSDDL